MKTKSALLPLLALVASLFVASALQAADAPAGELIAPTDKDAAWLTEARAAYPLKTCLISEEELGGMGTPVEFIYRQAGQADQLVRFCCKMCVPKFKKDPAKYLALVKAGAKPEAKPDAHPHH
jgi:hypothetical protein